MKIIVDAFGGDRSPDEIIKGTLDAIREKDGFDVVFCGQERAINAILAAETDYDASRVSVLDAQDVITCDEAPVEAVKKKPNSSIVVSAKALKEDSSVKAFVSAGSTGAVLAAAMFLTPRIKGILRPALAPALPNKKGGQTLLLDCGATADAKPVHLAQYAVMGSAYASEIWGIKNPKVALLSNGTEDAKGNAVTKEAFALLKENKSINFVGNMEAREILSGDYDVVVSDGFNGNVALKSTEGAVGCILSFLKAEIKSSKKAMIGALFMKGAFANLKDKLDYNKRGGAVLLGMEKVIVKAHGSSNAVAFKSAVLQARDAAATDLCGKIKRALCSDGDDK